MNGWRDARFFVVWAVAFAAGLLAIFYGGRWGGVGILIVAPTILALLLFAWGYLLCQVIKWCGGDPKGESVGMWIFLSFAFLLLPLLIALTRHRRWG